MKLSEMNRMDIEDINKSILNKVYLHEFRRGLRKGAQLFHEVTEVYILECDYVNKTTIRVKVEYVKTKVVEFLYINTETLIYKVDSLLKIIKYLSNEPLGINK